MKKLMFGLAALAAGSVMAIESQNVVGYATDALKAGNTAAGAQFTAVSGEGVDLTEIKPTGYNVEEYVGGSIYVMQLTANGTTVAGSQYFWYDDEDGTGWFDGSDEPLVAGTVILKPGEALWIRANSASEGLQSAGQVAKVSIDVSLRAGNKLLCNPTPVAVNWNDDDNNGKFIVASGYVPEEYVGGSIYAMQLTASGTTVPGSQYFWYDDEDGTGWFDGSDELVQGEKLPAGVGIWVRANSNSEKLTFPAAL